MVKKIEKCRLNGSLNLISILSLGDQALTGVFPKNKNEIITSGPLELVWCPESGLLQLAHVYEPSEMYGHNYGYRSGLNQSMVHHLTNKIHSLQRLYNLDCGDVVVDIGSNDATSLKAYTKSDIVRVGIDPTGEKFKEFYDDNILLLPDFFSANSFDSLGLHKAKIITSIAMFYDLENPIEFVQQIKHCLAPDGVWHFEQSYLPSMLRLTSYDTICHEHIEYYSLSVVTSILEKADLDVIDVQMNSINGGSFAVTAAHRGSKHKRNTTIIEWLLNQEERMALHTPKPYRDFEDRVYRHREDLRRLIISLKNNGKKIFGYGASTKGNVLLQFCGLTADYIDFIAEVNTEKFGAYTPGTNIPIVSEAEAKAMNPDYFLVLPWHFKHGILQREADYLSKGGKMIFPFPEIEIV